MFTCGFERSNFSFDIFLSLCARPFRPLVISVEKISTGQKACAPKLLLRYSLNLSNHLFRNTLWRLLIAFKMHSRGRAALCGRAQVSRITKHLREGPKSRNHLCATWSRLCLLDLAAPAPKVTIDGSHIVVGSYNLNAHNGLEENRLGLF